MKIYLVCKVDKRERLEVTTEELLWLINHATDTPIDEVYDILVQRSVQGGDEREYYYLIGWLTENYVKFERGIHP